VSALACLSLLTPPIGTGMRLVALAEMGSRPISIQDGKDTADPDDAAVLRKPRAKPAPSSSSNVHKS